MKQLCKTCGSYFDNAEVTPSCPPCITYAVTREHKRNEIRNWIITTLLTAGALLATVWGVRHLL